VNFCIRVCQFIQATEKKPRNEKACRKKSKDDGNKAKQSEIVVGIDPGRWRLVLHIYIYSAGIYYLQV